MVEKVKAIIDTDLEDSGIQSYIDSAEIFLQDAYTGVAITDDLYNEVKRWLTAHLIALTRERVSVKEEAGGAKIEYGGAFGEGLMATPYGQTAVGLDSTGRLGELAGKGGIYFQSLG